MTGKFVPYANEADVIGIGNVEVENRLDRVSLMCDVVLTKDQVGLALARQLHSLIGDRYYNSAILSHLLTKCEASGNAKAVALITKISPAAWRHILLNGHYTFQSGGKMIDLDALVAGLALG